jgi:hypothetical protein
VAAKTQPWATYCVVTQQPGMIARGGACWATLATPLQGNRLRVNPNPDENLEVIQTWFNSESGLEAGVSQQLRHVGPASKDCIHAAK